MRRKNPAAAFMTSPRPASPVGCRTRPGKSATACRNPVHTAQVTSLLYPAKSASVKLYEVPGLPPAVMGAVQPRRAPARTPDLQILAQARMDLIRWRLVDDAHARTRLCLKEHLRRRRPRFCQQERRGGPPTAVGKTGVRQRKFGKRDLAAAEERRRKLAHRRGDARALGQVRAPCPARPRCRRGPWQRSCLRRAPSRPGSGRRNGCPAFSTPHSPRMPVWPPTITCRLSIT